MPIEKSRCGCCGEKGMECPECGGNHVTPLDNPQTPKPTNIAIYGGPQKQTYTNVCWDCGWKENVIVTFDREEKG